MKLLAPVWELARELSEMRYIYGMPHRISAEKFDRLLPDFVATDLKTVMHAGLPADINPDKPVRASTQAPVVQ
jgi:hypothetical protein